VIRALLNDPHRDWHQNALARESRISIGTVNALVDRLEREGFVRRVGVGRRHQILRLIRPGELLDRWADHWREVKRVRHRFFHRHSSPEQLMRELRAAATELYREGLLLGQQRILLPSPGDTSRLALTPASEFAGHKVEPVAYTGLAGAHLLHGHVSFAVIEAYVPIDAAVLARRLGMLAADEGPNVVLIAPPDEGIFHCTVHRAGLPVVCLPQLYVDLVAGGGRAQGEAAPRVREDLLKAGEGRHG
jgi:DNA-binding MarR family transcriptional regulator